MKQNEGYMGPTVGIAQVYNQPHDYREPVFLSKEETDELFKDVEVVYVD